MFHRSENKNNSKSDMRPGPDTYHNKWKMMTSKQSDIYIMMIILTLYLDFQLFNQIWILLEAGFWENIVYITKSHFNKPLFFLHFCRACLPVFWGHMFWKKMLKSANFCEIGHWHANFWKWISYTRTKSQIFSIRVKVFNLRFYFKDFMRSFLNSWRSS